MSLVKLTGKQYEALRDAIVAAFEERAFSDFLFFKLELNYDAVSGGPTYIARIISILKHLVNEDRIVEFLDAMVKEKPRDPTVKALQSELKVLMPSPAVDHYEVCCLSGSHVMVNRARLRAALRELREKPLGKRILVVKGESKGGKTHSLQLIAYLHQVYKDFRLVPVDLEQVSSALPQGIIHVEDLAKQIVSRLDGYEKKQLLGDPPNDTQRASWALNFLNELEGQSENDQHIRWIIIDHLQKVKLPEPTIDLIKGLAKRINSTLAKYRLILLDYTDTFPPEVLLHVEEDNISRIDREEIQTFFTLALKQHQMNVTDADVRKAVDDVLNQVNVNAIGYLMSLEAIAAKELTRVIDGRR